MRINKHDTNGIKPLLGKGELGYDDYDVGGDAGRVYVGTGSENIPLAKKFEANMMTKAQFNALAEERKANRGGSGFENFGKGSSTTSVNVNEGIWTDSLFANKFFIGKTSSNSGTSITNHSETMVNGILQKLKYLNSASAIAEILCPTAPNIYPHDTVLTTEQINSGVIKHADSSNSGLIVNGKFDTNTSGWSSTNATLSVVSGKLRITATTSGVNGYASQAYTTIIGKKYTLEIELAKGTANADILVGTSMNGAEIYNATDISSTSMTRLEISFTATTTTTYVTPKVATVTSGDYAYFDNVAVYPADAISRSDLVFLESWHEDVSEKNFVYPLGNTQYLGGNTDGLTGITNGNFTGFETYSLFGNWQTPSALIGKGYVWSNLTEAQKRAFIANPENNCYLDGDKVIQVRYRVRVVQGLGDNWSYPLNSQSWVGYSNVVNTWIKAKGKQVATGEYLTSNTSEGGFVGGVTTTKDVLLLLGDYGVYGASNNGSLSTQCGYEGKCFALPIALIGRRNQGMYHNVYNPNGTKLASDGLDCFRTTVSFTSISDCFDPAKLLTASGYIGSVSGRPDGLFYDQVHESDITDLRNSSKKVKDYNRLIGREFNKLVDGTTRGKEGEKLFKPITFTNCGFIQYGSPIGTKQPYRLYSSSSFMPKWHSYWGSSVYGNINQLFGGGVTPNIPFAVILAKKDSTNYFIEVSPSPSYVDLVVFRTLDGTPTLPNVGSLVELIFDEITWLWLPSAYEYMGASYGHKNSIISTRTKSNTLLHCDIIGNPTNYPTAWKQSGVFGTPLIVAEDGTSLLPDGARDTFKLSRKANAIPLLCLRSTDSGATWTSFTPTFSTTANAITLTDEPAGNLVVVYYQTKTSMAVATVNREVLELGEVWAGNRESRQLGAYLCNTLISKTPVNSNNSVINNQRCRIMYTSELLNLTLVSTVTWGDLRHEVISLGITTSPTVKVLPYLTRTNGKACLNLVFKEMKHNGTSWGDDSKFNIVDNVSTTTDNNAQTVLVGQKTVELPYFIGADE